MIKVHLQLNPIEAEAFGIGSTSQKWPGFFKWNSRFHTALPKFATGTCHQKDEFMPNFQHFLKTNCNMKQLVYAQSSEHVKEYF